MKYLKKYNESNYRSISDLKDLIYHKLRELKEDIDDGFNIQINDKPYTLNHIDGVEREFVKCKVMKESNFDYSQISETIEGLKKMMEIEGWSLWDYSCYLGHRPPTAKIEREYTESCYSFNITFVKGDNLDSPYAYMMGMKRYQLKTNEELFASTYKSAADILSKKGHVKRPAKLMNWYTLLKQRDEEQTKIKAIKNAAQLGVYKCRLDYDRAGYVGDFYINLSFVDEIFEENYSDFKDDGGGSLWLPFNIGIIPVDEEALKYCEEKLLRRTGKGSDKVTYWLGEFRIHLSNKINYKHIGLFDHPPKQDDSEFSEYDNIEGATSPGEFDDYTIYHNETDNLDYRWVSDDDVGRGKWVPHFFELEPIGKADIEIFEGSFNLANRFSAVQFKTKLYEFLEGNIVLETRIGFPDEKDRIIDFLCNEKLHSIEEYIKVMESIKKISLNTLYKD